jgi:hypothetical protein
VEVGGGRLIVIRERDIRSLDELVEKKVIGDYQILKLDVQGISFHVKKDGTWDLSYSDSKESGDLYPPISSSKYGAVLIIEDLLAEIHDTNGNPVLVVYKIMFIPIPWGFPKRIYDGYVQPYPLIRAVRHCYRDGEYCPWSKNDWKEEYPISRLIEWLFEYLAKNNFYV